MDDLPACGIELVFTGALVVTSFPCDQKSEASGFIAIPIEGEPTHTCLTKEQAAQVVPIEFPPCKPVPPEYGVPTDESQGVGES